MHLLASSVKKITVDKAATLELKELEVYKWLKFCFVSTHVEIYIKNSVCYHTRRMVREMQSKYKHKTCVHDFIHIYLTGCSIRVYTWLCRF